MLNKELKELWESKEKSLEEVEKILLTRKHKFIRGRCANIDLLITHVEKTTEDDEDLFVTISAIYSTDELPESIKL